ncbi:hypothetical protein GPJ59_15200 [Streptomyces bambusae]|uniref:PE-PGRS family protein n=1 Tax=Streptomyces bambusae TaxID=1550616 RepID=A0ABS6Z7J2_9ACTN|nr:hypothetical protein [Streptomyces bambusae]
MEPVEAAVEADAVDAITRAGNLVVRGPLFGVAAQGPDDGRRWRVVIAVGGACPQYARDSLNSLLWFRAKDDARDRAERRALLAAVARLESERVDDVTVGTTRYRVVRAEEYAGTGPDGMEQPRPTDPEPPVPDWDRRAKEPGIDDDLVLDPEAPVTPTQALEQLALRNLCYTGQRFPDDVRSDSRRALDTHPRVLLLPTTFTVVERSDRGWKPVSGPHVSAHAARKSLDFCLTWAWPRMHGLIPVDTNFEADARSAAKAGGPDAEELAGFAEAADRLRAGRVNRLEFEGTVYQIGRTRRLLRWGPDGPEGPRPSDTDSHDPERIHPVLDEDGNVVRDG